MLPSPKMRGGDTLWRAIHTRESLGGIFLSNIPPRHQSFDRWLMKHHNPPTTVTLLDNWRAFLTCEEVPSGIRRHPRLLEALLKRNGESPPSPRSLKRASRTRLRLVQGPREPRIRCQRQSGAWCTIEAAVARANAIFSQNDGQRAVAIGILETWGRPPQGRRWSAYVTGWNSPRHRLNFIRPSGGGSDCFRSDTGL